MTVGSGPTVPPCGPEPAVSASVRLSAVCGVQGIGHVLTRLRDFDGTVGSIVPPVFERYARIFHPALQGMGEDEVGVRWAQVAEANGRAMHPAAEWGAITGSWEHQCRSIQPGLWDRPPSTGELPRVVARRLVEVLAERTTEPGVTFFGVWEGWGAPRLRGDEVFDAAVAEWRGLLERAATAQIPGRRLQLLQGPLVAIDDFYRGCERPSSLCLRYPPSLWWPADERWCVGTDIDLMTTYAGGSREVIEALLADDRLEALPVRDDQRVTWDADTINPLPPPP